MIPRAQTYNGRFIKNLYFKLIHENKLAFARDACMCLMRKRILFDFMDDFAEILLSV